MIQSKIIAHSKNIMGDEIVTFVATFPRYILAELNTHRMFSRNSASSRAIPFKKMVEIVDKNPFIPYAWQEDHSGMQGTKYNETPLGIAYNHDLWLEASKRAISSAKNLNENNVTKQLANRPLEPFMWHTALITTTDIQNFFDLRCPQYVVERTGKTYRSRYEYLESYLLSAEDNKEVMHSPMHDDELGWLKINKGQADIHMMLLAESMYEAFRNSPAKVLAPGEWHMPFGDSIDLSRYMPPPIVVNEIHYNLGRDMEINTKLSIATARCARTSYNDFEGNSNDYAKDVILHDRLLQSGHWSPFEHCAKAMSQADYDNYMRMENGVVYPGYCRNFKGFIQYRAMVDNYQL